MALVGKLLIFAAHFIKLLHPQIVAQGLDMGTQVIHSGADPLFAKAKLAAGVNQNQFFAAEYRPQWKIAAL